MYNTYNRMQLAKRQRYKCLIATYPRIRESFAIQPLADYFTLGDSFCLDPLPNSVALYDLFSRSFTIFIFIKLHIETHLCPFILRQRGESIERMSSHLNFPFLFYMESFYSHQIALFNKIRVC